MRSARSPFLAQLRSAIDAAHPAGAPEGDVDLACKIALYAAAGHPAAHFARLTGATVGAVRRARALLTNAVPHLEAT